MLLVRRRGMLGGLGTLVRPKWAAGRPSEEGRKEGAWKQPFGRGGNGLGSNPSAWR